MSHGEGRERPWTLANIVTASRLALAPAMLALAFLGYGRAFALVLAASLAIDVVDGRVARWLGQESRWGARLDSWGDLSTYACVPLCAYWLRPELVQDEAATFWTIVGAFAVPVVFAFIKYGALTSYHTRGTVLASYLVGGGLLLLFAGGPIWPMRIAAAVLVAAELEEIAITALLPEPVTLVGSLRRAVKLRRESFADHDE
jgi:CDP-diacylglycerol--glycerol-3-phosphate 3-phosphatidyltransferase